ncbi:rhodanese-like domain-containing protein [Candidatus Schneideria nysicola]|uniref:rhodanese-like domain-containing protein n=1 Tax=Candidatus Schneideria nysicola TaxID=1081631 RepID=UPI001CAA6121|nr:rhodanese-like domain-containing protein [Candidatus Schneideria nysicola]UAJ65772.1 rhodanese-like domain-containing protein [Candidatus Schneideria nysicola]
MIEAIIQFILQHPLIIITWLILLVILIFHFLYDFYYRIKFISNDEVIYFINKCNAKIIDLRNSCDYEEGHIINSINITLDDIKAKKWKFSDKKQSIIFIHNNGFLIRRLIRKFHIAGYQNIYVLKEGILGWEKANLPLIKSEQHTNKRRERLIKEEK